MNGQKTKDYYLDESDNQRSTYANASNKELSILHKKYMNKDLYFRKLEDSSRIMEGFLVDELKTRIDKEESEKSNLDSHLKQINKFVKHWKIMSASMIKVNRSISLGSFRKDENLWINPQYGIKFYRTMSSCTPFTYHRIRQHLEGLNVFSYSDNELMIMSEESIYDFSILKSIPQLDQERVGLLLDMTKEIVDCINSWKTFYSKGINGTSMLKILEQINNNLYFSDKDLESYINNIDKIILFKKDLSTKIESHIDKWDKVLNKWKEHNKNFLVLHQLRNSMLKIYD